MAVRARLRSISFGLFRGRIDMWGGQWDVVARRRLQVIVITVTVLSGLALAVTRSGGQTFARSSTAPPSWPMFLYNLSRSDYDPQERAITPANVKTLKQVWSIHVGGAISDQLASVGGVDYWGSWDGYMHATEQSTGRSLWKTQIGSETDTKCYPTHVGVGSSPDVATVPVAGKSTEVVFVGGGNGSFYALNATTGKVIWSDHFGKPVDGFFLWSSAALYRGNLYFGLASVGSCPNSPGELVQANPATGAIEATFKTRPTGCVGAGVWSSPTIDTSSSDIYFATGNDSGFCPSGPEPLAQAMIEVTPRLSLVGSYRIPNSQQLPQDSDFGATPTLFTARIHGATVPMVGDANKNGIFYAFRRNAISAGPVWETPRLTTGTEEVSSAAWDGSRLYVGGSTTTVGHRHCQASLRALNPANGQYLWADCLTGGDDLEAVVAPPGLVWTFSGPNLYVAAARTGKILFKWTNPTGAWEYAPVSFSGRDVLWGDPHGALREFAPAKP